MTLNDMELFEADLRFALMKRDEARKVWEEWDRQLNIRVKQELSWNLGEAGNGNGTKSDS